MQASSSCNRSIFNASAGLTEVNPLCLSKLILRPLDTPAMEYEKRGTLNDFFHCTRRKRSLKF